MKTSTLVKAIHEGEQEEARYRRLLASHDWYFEYADDHKAWSAGREERAQLIRLQQRLDPEGKVWKEYAR